MDDMIPEKPAGLFADTEQLLDAMGKAVQNALRLHKLLGHPIVIWRDGKVVWIPPEEIELDPEANGTTLPPQ